MHQNWDLAFSVTTTLLACEGWNFTHIWKTLVHGLIILQGGGFQLLKLALKFEN